MRRQTLSALGLMSRQRRADYFRPRCEVLEDRCVPNAADLDAAFGVGGTVTTDLGGTDELFAMALQTDGKIVAVGRRTMVGARDLDIAVVRYLSDGSLDTAFGAGGATYLNLGDNDVARAVAVQADGKIVVAGSAYRGITNHDFVVARFNTDGTPDASFGTGGYVTTDFGISAASMDFAYGMTLQADGKIIAVGSSQYPGSNFGYFAVVRYNADGTLDNTFAGDGKQATQIGGGAPDRAQSVAVQADGKIVVAGIAELAASTNFGVARYNANGTLDASFGTNGTVMTDINANSADDARALAIQSDGKIVVAGETFTYPTRSFALARYTISGALDTTFDGDGKVVTSFGAGASAYGVGVQANGRIVAAGYSSNGSINRFALIRYAANGSLDASFGTGGGVATSFGTSAIAYALAIQPDGKLVAGGITNTNFALARYVGDPVVDPPVADAGGPYAVAEGGQVVLNASGTTDPNQNPATLLYEWDLDGDGVYGERFEDALRGDEVGRFPTFSAFGLDGPGTYTVHLRVTDAGLLTSTDTATINLANAAPTVSAGGDASIDEGATFTRNGSFIDPGADTWTATVNYGDGGGAQSLSLNADKTFNLSHTYADNGAYVVTVTITDDDNAAGAASFAVTVDNVAPTVAAGGNASLSEGATLTRTGSFTDPGADSWSAIVNYGDGTGDQSVALNADKTFNLSHVFADNGVYTATITVADDDNGSGTTSFTVSVGNVAPVVSAGGNTSVDEGATFTRAGSFTDPGADSWSATVNYGDGGGNQSLALNADKTFNLSHAYADNGVYTVTVTVVDDDGGSDSKSFVVTVNNVAPSVAFTGPTSGVRGQTLSFAGNFADAGADAWSAVVNFGDGSGNQAVPLNADKTFNFNKLYSTTGNYMITVAVQDDDGGAGSQNVFIPINIVDVQSDPLVPGQSLLAVGGTLAGDKIQVNPGGTAGTFIVKFGNTTLGAYSAPAAAPFGRIAVFGQAGDDDITVHNSITLSAWLEGQDGNDKLRGGAGNDVLRGGAGNDQLYGNAGRDLLLGGIGADRLQGDAGENIYIAGTTSHDAHDAALMAILREWSSPRSRSVRLANLTDGSGSADGVNGSYFLNADTIFNDAATDTLFGTTSGDWLFYDSSRDRLRR